MKQATLTTGTKRVPVSVKVGNLFTWANVAKLLNTLPLDVCHCDTEEDAKGYAKVLIYITAAFIAAGLEGRAYL